MLGIDQNRILKRNKINPMTEGVSIVDQYAIGYDLTGNEKWYDKWTGKFIEYVVKDGDTLESLAKRFEVKPNEITHLNRVRGNMISDYVNTGQKLLIPLMS